MSTISITTYDRRSLRRPAVAAPVRLTRRGRLVLVLAVIAALAVGAVVALASVALVPLLRLDSAWPVVLAGATLVPLTVMGAQAGIAQGSERWRTLTGIYLANGFGRLLCGTIAVLVVPSATSAMVGIAVGAWAPVLVGMPLLRGHLRPAQGVSRRPLVRETVLGSHALLAYFVLSSLDALVARNRFEAHEAGLYAAGLILSKAALFAPQFVSVVLFPDLARDETRRARAQAVLAVAGLGAVAVAATALLPRLALVLVGGAQYEEIAGRLWLFALAGSCLAVVHLLVFDALARHAHGVEAGPTPHIDEFTGEVRRRIGIGRPVGPAARAVRRDSGDPTCGASGRGWPRIDVGLLHPAIVAGRNGPTVPRRAAEQPTPCPHPRGPRAQRTSGTWRSGGARPASARSRRLRCSSRSMTTASPGRRCRRKVTTQSSQVLVWRSAQVSQSRTRSARFASTASSGVALPDGSRV